jgi:hypothetical protein
MEWAMQNAIKISSAHSSSPPANATSPRKKITLEINKIERT